MFTDVRLMNDEGGLLARRRGDGIEEYLEPGSEAHTLAQSGAFGAIAPLPVEALRPVYGDARLARLAVTAWINGFLAPLVEDVPLEERLSWAAKEVAARAHVAGAAEAHQTAFLSAEAAFLGETLDGLAGKVIAKADLFREVVARVAGLRRKLDAQIEAATDPFEYEAILAAGIAEASALAEGLGLSDLLVPG